jgi:hypothetical protein
MRVYISHNSNSLIALGGSNKLEERLSPGIQG